MNRPKCEFCKKEMKIGNIKYVSNRNYCKPCWKTTDLKCQYCSAYYKAHTPEHAARISPYSCGMCARIQDHIARFEERFRKELTEDLINLINDLLALKE